MLIRRPVSDPWEVWVYCSVDYSALELCALSQVQLWLFGHSRMGEAINVGQDLHTRLAGRMMGLDYAAALALKDSKDPLLLSLRQAAKPVNFGLGGLMGPPKLVATARKDGVRFCELAKLAEDCSKNPKRTAYGQGRAQRKIPPTCEVCLDLAVKYSALWYEEWDMHPYHDATIAQAEECANGTPLESFGDGMLRLEPSAGSVSNHFFQNLAAQGAKRAGAALSKEAYTDRRSVLYNNLRVNVFVHDENMSEIREPVAHECAYRKADIMVSEMQKVIPDVKITAVPALMRRWFKNADTVHDSAGRLRPWWPPDSKKPWDWGPDQELMRADLAA